MPSFIELAWLLLYNEKVVVALHYTLARFVKLPSPGLGGGHNQINFIAPLDFCDYFRST